MDHGLRQNNFDLIRLAAALSVVAAHLTQHGILTSPAIKTTFQTLWQIFPGVQIFFIVSGFLIANSWLNKPEWKSYLKARALRILPALFVSTCVTSALLWAFGYTTQARWDQLLSWFWGTVSTLYVYHTPKPLVGFAGDMPNASVWTLPIEMQFYFLLPALLLLKNRCPRIPAVYLFMALSIAMVLFDDFGIRISHPDPRHTVLHHFWWFGMGVVGRLYWDEYRPYLQGNCILWTIGHLGLYGALWQIFGTSSPATATLSALTLAPFILSAAFTYEGLSRQLLRGRDWSYGIYLFHRPWIHTSTALGFIGLPGLAFVMVLTLGAAALSWRWIEQPCLRFKKREVIGGLKSRAGRFDSRRSTSPSFMANRVRQLFL